MGVVHLVRHGQATGLEGAYDELSDLGREQARAVGAELARRGVRPARVITGGLARQRQTAAEMGLTGAEVDRGWDEYDHLALLGALPAEATANIGRLPDPARTIQELLDAALARWVGATGESYAETWPAFCSRARDALADIDGSGTTVVVTSAGPISAVVAALLGVPPQGWLAVNRVMINASITTVALGRSGASLVTVNDHAHVAGDGRRLLTYR
jgi:broad specificity phosphatase PhoE